MGKMVRWNKRDGWVIGLTPYQYHLSGLHLFQRYRFKGLMFGRFNRNQRPI